MSNPARVLLQTILQIVKFSGRALTRRTLDFTSMGSDEAEVQFVESSNNITAVEPDTTSIVDVDVDADKQVSFSRFALKSRRSHQSKSFCVEKDGIPQHNYREQEKHDYTVPGAPQSNSLRVNSADIHSSTLRSPLETSEVVEIPMTQKTPITDAEPPSRRHEAGNSHASAASEALAYNENQLRSDRARREARRTSVLRSLSTTRDGSVAVNENENEHQFSQRGTAFEDPSQQPAKTLIPRRSLRQASAAANTKLTEEREKAEKVFELEGEETAREVKDLTSTEISYNGPRHLIFIYPPGGRGKIGVTVEERERLRQRKYLNDSLIDFYLKYLETDLKRRPAPLNFDAKFFSSFFFGVLRRVKQDDCDGRRSNTKSADCIDYEGVKNWTKGVDLFSMDFIIVPICDSYHWSLIIVANLKDLQTVLDRDMTPSRPLSDQRNPADPKIIYLDSLDPKRGNEFAKLMRHYLAEEWLSRKKQYSVDERLRAETRSLFRRAFPVLKPNVPVQNNEYDCGLYLLNSLSMFLDNTDDFMEKSLAGELQLREAYNSGDITKLRKNITCLMDSFEDEWKRNHANQEVKNEGRRTTVEDEESAKANETEKPELQMVMESVYLEHPIPPFCEVDKICSEMQSNNDNNQDVEEMEEEVTQGPVLNHIPLDEDSDSESVQGPEEKPSHALRERSKNKAYAIGTGDEADVSAMEIDENGDENAGSSEEGLRRGITGMGEAITENDKVDCDDHNSATPDLCHRMRDTEVRMVKTHKVCIDPKPVESDTAIRGAILSERPRKGQVSCLKRKRRHSTCAPLEAQRLQQNLLQRSTLEIKDLMGSSEETLDEGKEEDISTPSRVTRRGRFRYERVVSRSGIKLARHTPSSGFGGVGVEGSEDEELQTRHVNGETWSVAQRRRAFDYGEMEDDSEDVQQISDGSDDKSGQEVATLDLAGHKEVVKRCADPSVPFPDSQNVNESSDSSDHDDDDEVQITSQGRRTSWN